MNRKKTRITPEMRKTLLEAETHQERKHKTGPKGSWKMTPEVIKKIEQAAAMDCTVPEICLFSGISIDTYYIWIKKNPELCHSINMLRHAPVLKAREKVVEGIADFDTGLKYLERKCSDEFQPKNKVENNTTLKGSLTIKELNESLTKCKTQLKQ